MKIGEVTGTAKLNEGYKLTYHEIMALFDTIEKGRYMPTDKIEDKAKSAYNKTKNAANSIKNTTASAANTAKTAASNASSFMSNAAKGLSKFSNNNTKSPRIEPTLNDSIIYEANFGDMMSGAKKWAKREVIQKKPIISANTLTKMWKELGSPTDSDEIVRMLVHDVQMPKNMVLQAMKTASSQEPNVIAFANLVKDQGLTKQVLAICDTIKMGNDISNTTGNDLNNNNRLRRKNKQRRSTKDWILGDSVIDNRRVISEKLVIPEDEIRKIITKAAMWKVQNGSSVAGTEEHVKDWANKIKSQTDAVAKMKLVKEIVNFLADIHGTDEWKKVVHGVDSIIKNDKTIAQFTKDSEDKNDDNFIAIATNSLANGKTMEKKVFLIANDILTEAGISWFDVSLKPIMDEGKIMIYETLIGTNIPVKQYIAEMVINKINREVKTIGRAKKI